jgi:hypothetical protein
MSRATEYQVKAEHCEIRAAKLAHPSLKAQHRDLARQWRGMAELAKAHENEPMTDDTKPRGDLT